MVSMAMVKTSNEMDGVKNNDYVLLRGGGQWSFIPWLEKQ